jgi:hypothetical protein
VKAQDEASSTLDKVAGKINGLSKDIKKSTSPLTNFGKSLKDLTKSIPGIGLVTAAVAGVTKAVKDSVKQMAEWEQAWAQIEATAKRIDFAASINKNLQTSGREILAYTAQLSNELKNTFSGGELSAAISDLTFDKTGEQIKEILKVATDLSAALGTDLKTAATQLNATLSGTTGQLGKMFPELKQLTKESLEAGEAISIIGEKVKGMAKEMSDSVQGSILRGKNLSSDLKEELGYYISDFFTPIRDQISDIKQKWVEALSLTRTRKQAKAAYESGTQTAADVRVLLDQAQEKQAMTAASVLEMTETLSDPTKLTELITQSRGGVNKKQLQSALVGLQKQYENESSEVAKLQKEYDALIETEKKAAEEAKKAAAAKSSATPATSTSSQTAATTTTPEIVKLTQEQIKAMTQLNAATYAAEQADKQRLADAAIEADLRHKAFQQWKEAADKIAEFKKDLKDTVLSSTGETGQLIKAYFDGGWKGVIIQLVSIVASKLAEVSGIINALYNFVSTLLDRSIKVIVEILEPILNPVLVVIQTIGDFVGSIVGILAPFIQIAAPILEFVGGVIYWIKTFLTTLLDYIRYGFTEAVNWIIRVYNQLVARKWEKSEISQPKSIGEINATMRGLWNGDFLDDYRAMLSKNYELSPATTGVSGSATYNAARDIFVTINFNDSFVYSDKSTLAIELAREIRRAEKMNLV